MSWTLAELARLVDGEVAGDPGRRVEGLRSLDDAGPDDLAFVAASRHRKAARRSAAGALLVARTAPELDRDGILVDDPRVAFVTLLEHLHPRPRPRPGIHPTAVVDRAASLAADVTIGPFVVVGRDAVLAAGVSVEAHAVIGDGCSVGAGSILRPHVVLYPGTRLGAGVEVHAGTVLGSDGFGYLSSRNGHRKIPQVGRLEVGDGVEIGALVAVDRGALTDTSIGDGSKIDNLVHLAHNVEVGRNVLICALVGVAGSSRVGDGAVLAGQVGVIDHVEVGAGTQVASKSAVMSDLPPGGTYSGIPAVEIGEWRRRRVLEGKLNEIWRAVRRLVERLEGPDREPGEGGS